MSQRALAIAALLFASAAWGLSFIIMKRALVTITPEQLMAFRFALAALLLVPFALRNGSGRAALRPALLLGVCFFCGFWLQTRGLLSTTASRSSFLTAIGVTIVPLVEALLYRVRVTRFAATGALLALIGAALLAQPDRGALNRGDLLTIACAFSFALHTVFASRIAERHSAIWLALIQIAFVAFAAAPFAAGAPLHPSKFAVVAIIVLAVVNTSVAFFLLMWAQARLTATEAAIVLSFEPVATAIAAVAIGDEAPSLLLLLGGGCIVAGMVLSQLRPPEKHVASE